VVNGGQKKGSIIIENPVQGRVYAMIAPLFPFSMQTSSAGIPAASAAPFSISGTDQKLSKVPLDDQM